MARSHWQRSREQQEEGVMSALEPVQLERLQEIGNLLKQERESKGMALDDVSAKTLIRPGILKAIEEADARPLPEPVYLKGFIRRYGDLLGLSGIDLAESFPWNPSQDVPSMFVAAAVTTAESVDDPRRPFSAPSSEARVVEPDPVLPEEPSEEAPQNLASQADAPLAEVSEAADRAQANTPLANTPLTTEAVAAAKSEISDPNVPITDTTLNSQSSAEDSTGKMFSNVERSDGAQPFANAESSIEQPSAGAIVDPSSAIAPVSAPHGTAESASPPAPVAASPGASQGGLPLPIIGAILAGVGLLAAIAFAIGNRTPQTATTPSDQSEQVSDAAPSEEVEAPASSAPTASPDSSAAASNTASPAPTAKAPDAKPSAETTAKPAASSAANPAKGEVALGVEVKGEAAWFFVEVDGFVVYEGISSDFKESFKGKEVVLGSSRPDLITVSVDGKQATTFGQSEGEKIQTFTAAQ